MLYHSRCLLKAQATPLYHFCVYVAAVVKSGSYRNPSPRWVYVCRHRMEAMTNDNALPVSADVQASRKCAHKHMGRHTSNGAGTSVRHRTSGLVKSWGGVCWAFCYPFISHCCPLVLITVGSFKLEMCSKCRDLPLFLWGLCVCVCVYLPLRPSVHLHVYTHVCNWWAFLCVCAC